MGCNREMFEVALLIGTRKPPAGKKGPVMPSVGEGVIVVNAQLVLFHGAAKADPDDECGFKSTLSAMAKSKTITFVAVAEDTNHTAMQRVKNAEDRKETLPAARVFIHRRDQDVASSLKTGPGVELTDVTVTMNVVRRGVYMVGLSGKSSQRYNF